MEARTIPHLTLKNITWDENERWQKKKKKKHYPNDDPRWREEDHNHYLPNILEREMQKPFIMNGMIGETRPCVDLKQWKKKTRKPERNQVNLTNTT